MPNAPLGADGAVKILYIDNFAVISTDRDEALRLVDEMETIFAEVGLRVERDAEAKGDGKLLGFQLDRVAGEWRPTATRFWKIALVLDWQRGLR